VDPPVRRWSDTEYLALLEMLKGYAAKASRWDAYERARPYIEPNPFDPRYSGIGAGPFPPPAAPAPQRIPWRVILGFAAGAMPTAEEIQQRWKKLSTIYHPDAGGATESFNAITNARDAALEDVAK
jgi:hypothetical protein